MDTLHSELLKMKSASGPERDIFRACATDILAREREHMAALLVELWSDVHDLKLSLHALRGHVESADTGEQISYKEAD